MRLYTIIAGIISMFIIIPVVSLFLFGLVGSIYDMIRESLQSRKDQP